MSRHTVEQYMTASPVVIESDRSLSEAHEVLRMHGIRHLPVVQRGALVGILSQRDLYLVETLRGVDAATETVAQAMNREPYTTTRGAPLDEVAREMADHKYGSAVVVDGGTIIGLFTTVDALRALAALLGGGGARRASRRNASASSA